MTTPKKNKKNKKNRNASNKNSTAETGKSASNNSTSTSNSNSNSNSNSSRAASGDIAVNSPASPIASNTSASATASPRILTTPTMTMNTSEPIMNVVEVLQPSADDVVTTQITVNPQDAELIQQATATAAAAASNTTIANGGGTSLSSPSPSSPQSQPEAQQQQYYTTNKQQYQNEPRNLPAMIVVLGVMLCLIAPTIRSILTGDGIAARLAMGSPRDARLPSTWEDLVHDTRNTFQVGFDPVALPTMFLGSIGGLEMIFLDDAAFYSWDFFLHKLGNTDIQTSAWTVPLKNTHVARLGMVSDRNITYLHPVSNPLAPPLARAHKRQRLERYNRNSVLIQSWTVVMDVPLADCFVVEDRILVEQYGTKNITISSYFSIEYTKNTMFKSIIGQQTTKEYKELLHEYFRFLTIVSHGRPQDWIPLVVPTTRTTTKTSTSTALKPIHHGTNPFKKAGAILSHPIKPVLNQAGRFVRFIRKIGRKNSEQHTKTSS
jgi:hypothetical protein